LDGDDKLTRTYFVPRSDYLAGDPTYVTPSDGDPDPNAARFPAYEFAEEKVKRTEDPILDAYFIIVERVYVNTQKLVGASEQGTSRGETGSQTKLGSSNSATPVAPGIIVQRSSRLTEFDLWHNTENRLALRVGVNQINVTDKVGYTENFTKELSLVDPVNKGETEFSKQLITQDADGQDAVWQASRKTRESRPAQGSEVTNFLGGGVASVDVSLVADTTSADSGFGVVESRVTPIGGGDAMKMTKLLDEYPTLVEERYDPGLDAIVQITKDVIVPGSHHGFANVGDIQEIKPVDKWRSIRIRSKAMGVERSEMLPGVFSFQFPAVLVSANMIGALASSSYGSNFDWDYDVAMVFNVREAFSAAVEGRVIRVVTNDPAAVLASYPPTVFKPESHTIAIVTAAAYNSPDTVWAKTSARTWQSPLALSTGVFVYPPPFLAGSIMVNAEMNVSIPASDPPAIPSGWLTVGASSQRQRMGYWEILIRQILSPGG